MTKTLTVMSVERIKPPAKGQKEHFDKGFPGLALRVSYAGGKSFGFYYRIGGRLRRVNLGTYPAISLIEAREAWRAARISVAKGVDPAVKEAVGRSDTFAAVVAEWIKRDQAPRNKARTLYQLENAVKLDLLPVWGARRIDTLGKRDVIELLDKIVDRGAVVKARRMYAHMHRFFKWSYGREIIATNPMKGVEKPGAEKSRERVLTDDELVAVWNACEGAHGEAIRLLILTGARISEISELKWTELAGDVIKLDGSRTKNGEPHVISLSTPARALLAAMPRIGEFVFSTDEGRHRLRGWSHRKEALDAKAGIEPWRTHDLRRTAATGLQKLGATLQTIEAVLGHTGGSRAGIVGVYQRHSFTDEASAALEAWAAHVIGLVEGRELGKVLPIRAAR